MQLWEKGLFDLDDELAKYMPEFSEMTVATENGTVPAAEPIRIRNLFTMTAGFSYNLRSPQLLQLRKDTDGVCKTRDVARYLAKEPLLFQPGDHYQYSLCHDVLAALVEVLSGQLFADYVQEHIFAPLGMEHSYFLLPTDRLSEVSTLHMFNAATGKAEVGAQNNYRLGTDHASGGAGCVSTVEDYIKFIEALRTGEKLLKRSTIRLMTTNQLTDHQIRTLTYNTHGYGLGMRTPMDGHPRRDYGWGGAAGAYLAIDEPNGICLYYAQHMLSSPNHGIRAQVYTSVLKDLGISATHTVTDPKLTY
jgi:CubicO group peptidase (beta-lactamase class C family)